jgi:hypothetical protein
MIAGAGPPAQRHQGRSVRGGRAVSVSTAWGIARSALRASDRLPRLIRAVSGQQQLQPDTSGCPTEAARCRQQQLSAPSRRSHRLKSGGCTVCCLCGCWPGCAAIALHARLHEFAADLCWLLAVHAVWSCFALLIQCARSCCGSAGSALTGRGAYGGNPMASSAAVCWWGSCRAGGAACKAAWMQTPRCV